MSEPDKRDIIKVSLYDKQTKNAAVKNSVALITRDTSLKTPRL